MKIIRAIILFYRLFVYALTRTRAGRIIALLSLPIALLIFALWMPTYEPPIFDAQVHYNKEAWSRISVEAVMNTAEEINVPWLLVGSIPNEGTWKLYHAAPERVIPMLVPGFTREDRDTWHEDGRLLQYIEAELKARPYRGLGEFFLFDGQVDTPVVRRVLELAVTHRLVLHTRSDPEAIRKMFALQPSLRILWAHAGIITPPEQVGQLMDRYPLLWVEISHRRSVAQRGSLDPEWRELMLRHPDRVLLGSGTYSSTYWHKFRTYLSNYRKWLEDLPPDVAEKIAYRNGLALFGIEYSVIKGVRKE